MSSSQSTTTPLGAPEPVPDMIQVPAERRTDAVRMLLSARGDVDSGRVRQFLSFAERSRIALDGLWSRLDSRGEIIHSVLAVPNPGRTAMFFATPPAVREQVKPIGELIDHACRGMAEEGLAVAQVLLDPSEVLLRQAFLCGGFTELARLSYLERKRPGRKEFTETVWPPGISLESAATCGDDALLQALEASYIDTLDCPGLRGLRETRDILAGHRATGEYDPDLWTLLRKEGEPAGILLLNPNTAQRSIELVYLGLAPVARGQGLGKGLLRSGLARVALRSERTINLAVDEANEPALRLYRGAGFRLSLRRRALIRPLDRESATHAAACGPP